MIEESNKLLYRDELILYLIHCFQGERTISGIYHLLKGKKSAQSIQDSYLFHVEPFFHTCEDLDRMEFDSLIMECQHAGWICPKNDNSHHYILTQMGNEALAGQKTNLFPDGLRLTDYINDESQYWLKLQLMVQSLSALVHHQQAYLPLTHVPSVTESVRRCLLSTTLSRHDLANRFYEELVRLLSNCPSKEADLLVSQLTGFKKNGLTIRQIAVLTDRDNYECRLLFKSGLRRVMKQIAEKPDQFPYNSKLLHTQRSGLSRSAAETLQRIRDGLSLGEVARSRRLTESTVEDHLVEIVLKDPNFEVNHYLTDELELQIIQTATAAKTRQLKAIKSQLKAQASYFQIRLALARNAVRKGETFGGTSR
ncbi:helix-turn-helix domain-containing protein [Sporolactobacillus kofuensis]|uniref:Helix-turn-helix domain-containing protein n=1 Tax=Sporolactobacillus kofuensis TaxID=269672 RepID=A0ABW1WDK2_9BACL|nr:helix-turn-helix domain-containing protein [Sporolactobacillus kofuensis]MCO7176625.1 helix-turn-helix domain-containing protein [Sporolactobacillus kofuensis]